MTANKNIKADKYLTLKQLKISLQLLKNAIRHLDACSLCYGYNHNRIAMKKKNFFQIARNLRIEPVITDNYMKEYRFYASFYYEGFEIYCIYNHDINEPVAGLNWFDDKMRTKFKEFFFESEDKQQAFLKLKEYKLSCLASFAKKEKQPIYWMTSYRDLEKYLRRHDAAQESYESRYNKYLCYKNAFEPVDENLSWGEIKRLRPHGDDFQPLSFKEWNKANY